MAPKPSAPPGSGPAAPFPTSDTRHFPWLGLLVVVLGAFMAILDGSIVNVALPKLMAIFGVDTEDAQWILTGYLLASGVVVPVTGYLGDRYGYKFMYIFALTAFTIGSALCGMAWSNNSLIAFRIVQAIGGGMIMPVSMAIIYRIVPRQKIGMALGLWGIGAIMAPAIGPTLGGYLVDNFSWHLIFTINIPIGFFAVLLTQMVLQETPKQQHLKFDYWGAFLCCTGCFALLLALSKGQDKGWTSQYIVTLFGLAFFSLLLFCIWELRIDHPMLDIRLFRNPVFSVSMAVTVLTQVGLFAIIFIIPLYTQNMLGMTPMQTGIFMMPMALATGLMMPISGRLFDKVGAMPLGVVGLTIAAVISYMLHELNLSYSLPHLRLLLVLRALGLGLAMMPLSSVGTNTVPPFLVGRATAINNLFRQIASSLGIAYLTYIMVSRQAYHAAVLSAGISVDTPLAGQYLNYATATLGDKSTALAAVSGLVQREALMRGMSDALLVGAIFVFLGLPFAFYLTKERAEKQRQIMARQFAHLAPPPGVSGPAAPPPGQTKPAGP
ncbi:MAG: DHA2 family efflux MFS transporter permease subunit [Desulfurispora sp.]|uniref:DHA2 family efflux MFS transporter permease subunit n=1 Tax=Desulfurispora sp. TaxID=3014275 RepID=UPI00404A7A66